MQLTRDYDSAKFIIKSYEPQKLLINETLYSHSVMLTPRSISPWLPIFFSEITEEDIRTLIQFSTQQIEAYTELQQMPPIILIGTGKHQHFLNTEILRPLIEHNIGFEVMSTLSACYTFKILSAEERNVVAGLIV